jgi:alkanesulfonate monooxygenase SsuD/methylene tetrahydromethanopterin reductase-like flavin-dependent oxidoreductase (luciferase family)
MLFLPYLLSSAPQGEAASPLLLAKPPARPGREPLRHILIGSPEAVRGAINHLHLLRYAEQLQWSRLFTVPESGITLSPEQGEVFSYLLRYRQLD